MYGKQLITFLQQLLLSLRLQIAFLQAAPDPTKCLVVAAFMKWLGDDHDRPWHWSGQTPVRHRCVKHVCASLHASVTLVTAVSVAVAVTMPSPCRRRAVTHPTPVGQRRLPVAPEQRVATPTSSDGPLDMHRAGGGAGGGAGRGAGRGATLGRDVPGQLRHCTEFRFEHDFV